MKPNFRISFFAIVFLILTSVLSVFFLIGDDVEGVSEVSSSTKLGVPIPEELLGNAGASIHGSSMWSPVIPPVGAAAPSFTLSATSALSYDLTTDTLLYAKNIDKRVPLASLTKIMTAVVALESGDLSEKLMVTDNMLVGENSMGLRAGEQLALEDLLYGLILPSGNDASEVIAQNSPFGRENFVYVMNKKGESIGMSDTRFTNPSGLQGDGEQYSTAYDLLLLTRYALQNAKFAEIVSTVEHVIESSETNREYTLYNDTNLLTTYPGVKGVKIGYTYEAGMCIVTYLEYEGHKIVSVLLNSGNRRTEMRDLLDHSLLRLGVEPPSHL